jgi:nitrate/nitrite transport system substrate-binding protein
MKRRQFLQYSTLTAAGLTFAACGDRGSNHFTQPPANFGTLEKTDLKIGIVSSLDCLPLVVAKEQGMFKKYGLNVTLVKEASWDKLQTQLQGGKLDAAQTLFAMPLWEYFGNNKGGSESREERGEKSKSKKKGQSKTVALMGLSLNGNSISLGEAAWKAGLRHQRAYNSLHEFQDVYNKYFRLAKQPLGFAISHPAAMANYTTRYWLGAMGINAERDLKFQVLAPKDIIAGLDSGKLAGYATDELFNQQTIADKKAFTAYIDRDIWHGHPEKILATLDTWLEENPTSAKAMMAAVLEACQFCEVEKNKPNLPLMLGKSDYTDSGTNSNWQNILLGNYNYVGLDDRPAIVKTPDFQIFHFQPTDYLQSPNHANFLWHSHAIWVITQMVRWNQRNLTDYPQDANTIVEELYPIETYADVAKEFGLAMPKEQMKVERSAVFIDRVSFDPAKADAYLNTFELRT